ncbi:MAG: 2'-5' RNA ligase family protein [Chloroflexota bacterium]
MSASNETSLREIYRFGTFVLWPPDGVRSQVNPLRAQYDPASQAACEAHITLTQPFSVEPDAAIWERIRHVARLHAPFTVRYGPVNSFLPYPCIYLEIEPAERILQLREDLHALGVFNLDLPHTEGFIPHMSITDGSPDVRETEQILNRLSEDAPSGSFRCTEITYIRPDDSFQFSVIRTFPLGGES